MEWTAVENGALEAKTDKWSIRIEQSESQGWLYSIKPLASEEPSVMGNSSSEELCKAQVESMLGIMAKWN